MPRHGDAVRRDGHERRIEDDSGGYAHPIDELEQWAVNDSRTPAEVFDAVRAKGFEPVWKDWSLFMQEANIPA